jgi:ABC-2 type transport system permease protein
MRIMVPIFLRGVLSRRRTIAVVLLALVPAVIATVERITNAAPDPHHFTARIVLRGLLTVVVPFVSVILAGSVLAEEREDATIVYLVTTPRARLEVVAAATASAWLFGMLVLVPVTVVTVRAPGAVGGTATAWTLLAVALECGAYCVLFVWLSLRTRRPVVIGIVYILIWEFVIAGFAPSAARFSIAAYARAIAAHGMQLFGDERITVPAVSYGGAVAALLAIVVIGHAIAARRLARVELP